MSLIVLGHVLENRTCPNAIKDYPRELCSSYVLGHVLDSIGICPRDTTCPNAIKDCPRELCSILGHVLDSCGTLHIIQAISR